MIGASDDEEVGRRAAAVTDRDERERKRGGKGGPLGGAGGGSMGSAGRSGFFDCLTRLLAAKFPPFSLRRGRPYR